MSKMISLSEIFEDDFHADFTQKLRIVLFLSLPTILAQIAEIVMQFIDSAMSGRLGAEASAAIGVVSSSTWLIGSLTMAASYGFSVQVAQAVGAKDYSKANRIFRQALYTTLLFSLCISIPCTLLAPQLPQWLKADPLIWQNAGRYFRIFCLFLPIRQFFFLLQSMLQCTGNMKTPSILGSLLCLFDVVFNYFFIFPTHTAFGLSIPGLGLGVLGAALGTGMAYVLAGIFLAYEACWKSPILNLKQSNSWKSDAKVFKESLRIAVPMGLEQAVLCMGQIISTRIVAPLGTIALAANSFAVTAEAFCYMPGYGIAGAATTLVGQSFGAKRKDLARSFGWLCTALGIAFMSITALIMYNIAPAVFQFLTPVEQVQTLGASVLRIELFAEPMFAASIVITGALRGAGDTMIPGILNLISMWGIRIPFSYFLSRTMGLDGVWVAMCIDLTCRGILFLIRMKRGRWLERMDENTEGATL